MSAASLIAPLMDALVALRRALDLKSGGAHALLLATDGKDAGSSDASVAVTSGTGAAAVTPTQWKQIQSIAAVVSQRAKLTEMADIFCSNYADFALSLF